MKTNLTPTNPPTETVSDCPFCQMFHGEDIIDIEPLNPVVPGHRLVIPKEHVTDFTDNPEVSAKVMEYASNLAKKLGGEYNLITSKGKSATQTVYHLHIHLVPRKNGDGLSLPWTTNPPTEPTVDGWERDWDIKFANFNKSVHNSVLDNIKDFIRHSVQEAKAEERERILKAIQLAVNDFMAAANTLVKHKMVKTAKEMRENTQYIVCAIRGTHKEYVASLKQEDKK